MKKDDIIAGVIFGTILMAGCVVGFFGYLKMNDIPLSRVMSKNSDGISVNSDNDSDSGIISSVTNSRKNSGDYEDLIDAYGRVVGIETGNWIGYPPDSSENGVFHFFRDSTFSPSSDPLIFTNTGRVEGEPIISIDVNSNVVNAILLQVGTDPKWHLCGVSTGTTEKRAMEIMSSYGARVMYKDPLGDNEAMYTLALPSYYSNVQALFIIVKDGNVTGVGGGDLTSLSKLKLL